MSKAATTEALQELHAALATELAVAIKETEIKIIDLPDAEAEGGTRKVAVHTRNAAVLSAARQFLKDNGIECAPGKPSGPVQVLASALPFPTHPGGDEEDRTQH